MPTVFNAANEVAVERFLRGDIRFLQIEEIIASVMEQHQVTGHPGLEEILAADHWARDMARRMFRP